MPQRKSKQKPTDVLKKRKKRGTQSRRFTEGPGARTALARQSRGAEKSEVVPSPSELPGKSKASVKKVAVTPSPFATTTSSAGAALPKGWDAFLAEPTDATARTVGVALQGMRLPEARASMKRIAEALARRPANERSAMSWLIASRLRGDVARGFLKESAGVRLVPTKPPPRPAPGPQSGDIRHTLDLLPPARLSRLPGKTPAGRDRLKLEGLDLAVPGQVGMDLAEAERRTDDVYDASSMGHLKEAMTLINSVGAGKDDFSALRRDELRGQVAGTTQEHLVEQIGFRAARPMRPDKTHLSPQNELAASYWRTNFRNTIAGFVEKLRQGGKMVPDGVLVNSPRVLKKLEMVLTPEMLAKLEIQPLSGKSGICVLTGTGAATAAGTDPDFNWDATLRELGATPSAYQLYELMDAGKAKPKTDFKVDARADLVALITGSPFARLQEIAGGKGELAPVCRMVENLVLGLTDELGPDRFDGLTANALDSLSQLIDIVVQNEKNPSVAMRAVDLMMDEIGIVVATAKNYTWTDYRKTMKDVLLKRAPSLRAKADKDIQLDSHLATSGMDALASAVQIALSSRDSTKVARPTEKIDYYEIGDLLGRLKKGQTASPRDDVLIAALNPSTPFDAPSPQGLVDDVLKRMEARKEGDPPFALILDTTIEVGTDELDVVLRGLQDAIASGRLEVFLCKSFQKYASFGTGKVAAGDLTMLSKKGHLPSAFARSEALLQDLDRDLAGRDEAQLVTHMLRHGNTDELALTASAAKNAKFVDEFCWPINPPDRTLGSGYKEGIPLLLRSTPTGDVDKLFGKLSTLDQRDSFSFLRSSWVGEIPGVVGGAKGNYVRINTGHEPKETMVENFFAFGHLATGTLPGTTDRTPPVSLDRLPYDAVAAHLRALDGVPDSDTTGIAQYRKNIEASYLTYAYQTMPRDKAKLTARLIDFFAKRSEGVTTETRRYLAGQLFPQLKGKALDADPVNLAGLCRAMEALPVYERKAVGKTLDLTKIGNSKDATLLRTLAGQ